MARICIIPAKRGRKDSGKILVEYVVSNVEDLCTPQLAFSWKFFKFETVLSEVLSNYCPRNQR